MAKEPSSVMGARVVALPLRRARNLVAVMLLAAVTMVAWGSPVDEVEGRLRHLPGGVTVPGLGAPAGPPTAVDRRLLPATQEDAGTPVDIPDRRLRAALEEAFGKEPGATILRADLASLRSFNASQRRIVDLTGLEFATNLTNLSLGGNDISDVSQLSAMTRLFSLWLSSNPIYDISPLANLARLGSVDLAYTNVRDLSPLANLTNLRGLRLAGEFVADLSPLLDLGLTRLQLDSAPHADLGVISRLTRLTDLELVRSGAVDLAPVASLGRLRTLVVSENPIKDLSPLAGLPELRRLTANNAQISDLSPLSGLSNLTHLSLNANAISDISALSGLVNLERLYLGDNALPDIFALGRMTRLRWLNLDRNRISNLGPLSRLPALTRLEAWDNAIADLAPLVRNPDLGADGFVRVFANPLSDTSIQTHVPALRARGVAVLWESHFSSQLSYQVLTLAPQEAREAFVRDDYLVLVAYRLTDLPLACEGTFELDLDIGGHIRRASSGYGVHDSFVVLSHVIREEDLDSNGLSVLPGTLRLAEGDCRHPDGSTVRNVRFAGALPTDDAELKVDGSIDLPARIRSVSVSPPAANGTFASHEPLAVRVEFDEAVAVEGLPRVRLRVGSALRFAALAHVERSALHFEYRVRPGDVDSNGIEFPDPLQLVGGKVRDFGGNLVDLDVPPTHARSAYGVRGDANDLQAPAIAEVSVEAYRDRWPVRAHQALRQNDRLVVRVAFDEYVEVQDTPTLALGIGQAIRQVPLSTLGGNELRFEYHVRAGDVDTDGVTVAADALALPGNAAIRDGSANVASLDLGRNVVPAGASHRVRGSGSDLRPTIVSADFVRFTPRRGARGVGAAESILFVVRYDEPVWVDTANGSPTAAVRLGAETRTFGFLGPGGRRDLRRDVTFTYVVQPSDDLALQAGVFVDAAYSAGTIGLNGATVRDGAGNPADLTWPPGFNQHWARVDGSLRAPATPEADVAYLPYTGFSGNRGPDRSFGLHETIDIPLHFSEAVSVAGEPTLPVQIGNALRHAAYAGGSGGRRLLFRYRVQREDIGPLRLPATRIALHKGAVRGSVGQAAGLLVGGVPVPDGFGRTYFVNGAREPDTPVPPVAAPTGITVAPGPGELVVSWEPLQADHSGGVPVTGYVVTARSVDGREEFSCRAAAGETRCVIDGADGTALSVTVRAVNSFGAGYASTGIVAVTEPRGGFWRGWRMALPKLPSEESERP